MKRLRLLALAALLVLSSLVWWTCAHWVGPVPGTRRDVMEHGGRQRTFLSVIPQGAGPFPLVLALHGRLGTGSQMLKLTRLERLATREGFVLVAPDGVERSWADGRGTTPAARAGVDDVGFLLALVDRFVAQRLVDPSRVYVVGMSNGGFMALTLACRAPERVAAVGSVTGLMGSAFAAACTPARPVPVMIVAGDEDPIVPFDGGELDRGRGHILGAEATFDRWRALDGCEDAPTVTQLVDADPADGTTVERREATGCREDSSVRLDVVRGGGHAWPKGDRYLPERLIGRTSRDLDASEELWLFLRRFRR